MKAAGGLHNEMGREIRGLERKFAADCGTIKKTYSSAGICFIQNSGTCQLIRRKKKCEKISERTNTFIRSHKTSDNIKAKQAFTVGIADEKNLEAADYVGIVSGHDEPDKIRKSGFHLIKSEFVDAPVIEDLPICLECRVEEINQYNATLRIVAEIVNVSADESILDGNGNINPARLKAISYDPANKTYLKVGGKAGNAFSDGNRLK